MSLPKLWLNPDKDYFFLYYYDVKLIDYQSHDALKAKMAV